MITLHPDNEQIEYRNEYDTLKSVYYKGEKYTGILKNDREHVEYKDGNAHGKYLYYYQDGNIETDCIYENGDTIESKSFYENGSIKSYFKKEPHDFKQWNLNSKLVEDGNMTYFNNGNLKFIRSDDKNDSWQLKAYSKNKKLIYTVLKDVYIEGKIKRDVIYEDDALFENYSDLFICENPELHDLNEWKGDHNIWMWFWTIYDKDHKKYLQIVNSLMTHPEVNVKKFIAGIVASHKYHKYIDSPNEENKITYDFIIEYTDYHDKRDPDREGKILNL